MMISGEEQNPLKCLSNLEDILNAILLIFYPLITHSPSLNNRCDTTDTDAITKKAIFQLYKSNHEIRAFAAQELTEWVRTADPKEVFKKLTSSKDWQEQELLQELQSNPEVNQIILLGRTALKEELKEDVVEIINDPAFKSSDVDLREVYTQTQLTLLQELRQQQKFETSVLQKLDEIFGPLPAPAQDTTIETAGKVHTREESSQPSQSKEGSSLPTRTDQPTSVRQAAVSIGQRAAEHSPNGASSNALKQNEPTLTQVRDRLQPHLESSATSQKKDDTQNRDSTFNNKKRSELKDKGVDTSTSTSTNLDFRHSVSEGIKKRRDQLAGKTRS